MVRSLYDNETILFRYQGRGSETHVIRLQSEFGTDARSDLADMFRVCQLVEL